MPAADSAHTDVDADAGGFEDVEDPEEFGIRYPCAEAARDCQLRLATSSALLSLLKNCHSLQLHCAHASAELWIARKAEAGFTRQEML